MRLTTISIVLLIFAEKWPGADLTTQEPELGKIMRPVDGAAVPNDQADIIATAPAGKLELDGQPIQVQEPFPNVFHVIIKVASGVHTLRLSWDGGKKEIRFSSGAKPPAGFAPFHRHPPIPNIQCTQCHEVNQRGRFRFKGGCFDCHQRDDFPKIHAPHSESILSQCGSCHNAHGSTAKSLLLFPKETACKQCHD
jgi:predicted CXXCH cytochrome family protein